MVAAALPQLLREHAFWMDATAATPSAERGPRATARVVETTPGAVLNRYWDANDTPRPESFGEDLHTCALAAEPRRGSIFRDIRAGAESGWDFSSRWFAPDGGIESIRCTELLPVDLNALLWQLEQQLAAWLERAGDARAAGFADAAETWNRRYAGDDFLFGTAPNAWLRDHAGPMVAAPKQAGSRKYPAIEAAPGRYVLRKA